MLRLTLLPIVLFFGTLILSIVAYFIIKKICKVIATTHEKGKNLAVIQKGLDNMDEIESEIKQLPDSWTVLIKPIVEQAKAILDEVMTEASIRNTKVSKIGGVCFDKLALYVL